MKKFKCLLTAMLLACSTASFAQFTNGGGSDVEAWKGFRFSYEHTFVSDEGDGLNGFNVGYVHAFSIAKQYPIFFETGLGLDYNRWSDSKGDYKRAINQLGMTIPLNAVFGVKINDMLTLKPFTGFYLRINLMANEVEKYDGKKDTDNLFDDYKDGGLEYKRANFGWQIGTTLDINRFNVGIMYGIDFNEIAEDCRQSNFQVRLGYNF